MTYRNIDRRRFTFLLSLGTDEYELKRFFSDCRVQLIQRGGRVQNLPAGDKARIRTLVYELPPAAEEVVAEWFSKHLTMSDPESPEKIIETFKLHEEVDEEVDEQTARRLARSCLVHLFAEAPPADLLEFLRTPIGGQEKAEEQIRPPEIRGDVELANIVAVMLDLVQGHDVDKHVDGLPTEIAVAAAGLQAAAKGRFDEARQAVDSLPPEATSRALLEQYIRQQEARGRNDPPRGPTVTAADSFSGAFDFEVDEILGYCTKADAPNAVFVHPIGVVRTNGLHSVSSEDRRRLFPATGDVMAFPGAKYPRQPRRGEFGIWRVEEHPTDKATHFHIAGRGRRVYELVSIPFPSTEYDSVREFIKDYVQRGSVTSLQPLLFVLSDGLIVGPRSDRSDLSKDEAFETGLLCWNGLSGWRLEGRQFVFEPVPKEQGLYECPPIASSIRKLLKPHLGGGGKTNAGLTKAQLTELTHLLGSGEVDLTARRLQRIKSDLDQIRLNQDALDALVEQLQTHSSVKERIDAIVREEAVKRAGEKTDLQNDIGRLQKERGEWEERIRKQKEEHRKLRDDTAKVVRAAFEKARTEGAATLAELAIFQELTGSSNQQTHATPSVASQFQPKIRALTKVDSDVVGILRSLGVPNQRAAAFAATGKVVFEAGMILCVRGIASRNVVERWAQSIGDCSLIESTIGLIDDGPLRQLVDSVKPPQALAILDANLSPLDVYARPIADAVINSVSNGLKGSMALLFSLSESIGQLAVPKSFERLSVAIDLEAKYDFGTADLDGLMERTFGEEDGILKTRLWHPIAEKLRANVLKLDAPNQELVLPILAEKHVSQA